MFPALPDYNDNQVKAVLACQMSSNDRIKLASEELHIGQYKFILTGNGLDVSTKKLKNISTPILEELKRKHIKLICYKSEILYEIARLKKIQKNNTRLLFLKENILSFSQFSNFIFKIINQSAKG